MKFIAILNKDIKPGLAVNALAQMALGLGHRFETGYPDVEIYWADTANVRAFRTIVAESAKVYSDFPHTMKGGNTFSLLENIQSTPEEEITYYASCYLADELDPNISQLLNENTVQLKGYTPFISTQPTNLLPEGEHLPLPEKDTKKTTTMVNGKYPLAQTINELVLANIESGRTIPYSQLNLLRVGGLQGVSFNTHPILKADSPAKHISMTKSAHQAKGLYVASRVIDEKNPLVTVTFGDIEAVEGVILKKQTRVFEPVVEFNEPKVAKTLSPHVSLSVFPHVDKKTDASEDLDNFLSVSSHVDKKINESEDLGNSFTLTQ